MHTYTSPPDRQSTNGDNCYETSYEEIVADLKKQQESPELDQKAYHGVIGTIAKKVAEHTEADSRGVLITLLVGFGNIIGRNYWFRVDATRHYTNEYACLTGNTALARKGTAADIVEEVLGVVDPDWRLDCVTRSISSGEALLDLVHDDVFKEILVKPPKGEKGPGHFETQLVKPGIIDKRRLLLISEFGEVLITAAREGCILSSVLRNGWDGRHILEINSRNSPIRATDVSLSILGGITREELLKLLPLIPSADGLANRFLWCLIEGQKCLPFGGPPICSYLREEIEELRRIVEEIRKGGGEMTRSPDADQLWDKIYREIRASSGQKVVDRGDAHSLRLSMKYALLDSSRSIEPVHVEAGYSAWKYAEACGLRIFGSKELSRNAQKAQDYFQEKAADGATRTELNVRCFGRHLTQREIAAALKELTDRGLAGCHRENIEGHWIERWFAIPRIETSPEQPRPRAKQNKTQTKKNTGFTRSAHATRQKQR